MNIILSIRGAISRFIKTFNLPLTVILKFLAYFLLFHYVAGIDGFAEGLRINSIPVQVILAILSTILPNRCGIFLAIVLMLANIWQLTMVGTGVAAVLFLFVYIMTSRLFPDQVYMLALVPLCLHYKLYLLLPVAAGMYIGVIALIPMICGVIMSILLGLLPEFMTLKMPEKIDAIPKLLSNIFKYTFNQVLHNDMLIFLMILFTVIVVLIYLLRKIEINYGAYIALVAGVVLGVICMMMGKMTFDIPDTNGSIIKHAILTLIILAFIEFMRTALDYESARHLSFEDDEYEYHVTAIPKIDLGKSALERILPERVRREEEPEAEASEQSATRRTPAIAPQKEREDTTPRMRKVPTRTIPVQPIQDADAQSDTRVIEPVKPDVTEEEEAVELMLPAAEEPAPKASKLAAAPSETPSDGMESFFEES